MTFLMLNFIFFRGFFSLYISFRFKKKKKSHTKSWYRKNFHLVKFVCSVIRCSHLYYIQSFMYIYRQTDTQTDREKVRLVQCSSYREKKVTIFFHSTETSCKMVVKVSNRLELATWILRESKKGYKEFEFEFVHVPCGA